MSSNEKKLDGSPPPEYFERRYRKVRGAPAFPPPSLQREEEYIQKMIWKDNSHGPIMRDSENEK